MTKGVETFHIVFGRSIADTIREALPLLGSTERVIGLPGSLSVGPISPPDPSLRQAWGASVLRADSMLWNEFDGDPIEMEKAWAQATALGVEPVFWVCFSSPMEHACFLAFAARMDGRSFDIVDATNLALTTAGGINSPWSLGMVRAQDVVASKLYETRRHLSSEDLLAASMAWSQLQRENAPFRIVRDGCLVSAPLTHYDSLLIRQAGRDWEIAARLIGRTIETLSSGPASAGQGTSDVVLFGRMLALGETGSLEITGAGPGMRDFWIRSSGVDRVCQSVG